MEVLALALLAAQPAERPQGDCGLPNTERDIQYCRHMEQMKEFEIKTVEIAAVGTGDEMVSLRPAARDCKLNNQVDSIEGTRAYFNIVNATKKSKRCLADWIRVNKPNLEWTAQKEKELEGFVQLNPRRQSRRKLMRVSTG
jgi:hypothetical protein